MARALEGIRIVDLTHVLAGPIATMILADLGAEVLHVEPPHGDDAREFGPFAGEAGKNRSAYFVSLNRNKKSVVLNLKHEKGKQILRELIKISDVIIENYRPTTMPELGFGWAEIQKINPAIIYASISGFGRDTPPEYGSRPAYDIIAQAYSGFMSITGPEDGAPCRAGASIGDIFAGHQAAIGILAALIHREKTGRGQYYDGSMVDGLLSVLENAVVQYTIGHRIPKPLGSAHPSIAPFQTIPTRDGWMVIAIGNDIIWERFCTAIGREDLSQQPEYKTNSLRSRNRKTLIEIVEKEMVKRTTRAWSNLLERESIPHSPINNIKQVCEDPCINHRKMLAEMEQPQMGRIKIAGSPIRLSETPGEVYAPAPLLGEHTGEILKNLLNYSAGDISRLKEEGVINRG
ncbi:MAG: CoA transferase [Dehalococcoidia bacterium]|nr:MAG: CoA transferase [Dehalococcoidia bacterium]